MSKKFILAYLFITIILSSNSYSENSRYFEFDKGIITLMYHRFDEPKYPSTNIQMDIFKKHVEIIGKNNILFISPKNFDLEFDKVKNQKKILSKFWRQIKNTYFHFSSKKKLKTPPIRGGSLPTF